MVKFRNHMISENVQVFWAALQRGEFITDAAVAAGTYRKQGTRWVIANGGVRPRRGRNLKGRSLTFAEREEIALRRAAGATVRSIAARLGRSPATISRELRRNAEPGGGYRASSAHAAAWVRASRPKPAKLASNVVLRAKVEQDLEKKYSPEQIAGRLRVEFPDDPEMWVSHETIYQSLYVQTRSALRRELSDGQFQLVAVQLETGLEILIDIFTNAAAEILAGAVTAFVTGAWKRWQQVRKQRAASPPGIVIEIPRSESDAPPLRLVLPPPVSDDELARYLKIADDLRSVA